MNKRAIYLLAIVSASGLLFTACGGGDDAPPPFVAAPAQASQDSASFTEYVRQLVASVNVDDIAAVDLSNVSNPPEDNDSPPVALSQ